MQMAATRETYKKRIGHCSLLESLVLLLATYFGVLVANG